MGDKIKFVSCGKCRKFSTCTEPCVHVEMHISQDADYGLYEKDIGDNKRIMYGRGSGKEIQESVLQDYYDDTGKPIETGLFSTESDSPWADYQPKKTHTTIFIHRALLGWSWADIATMLDTSPEHVRGLYKDSVKRLLKALEIMDTRGAFKNDIESRLRISEKSTGKLPKTHRYFLMAKVFKMLPREIAELEGANIKTVCSKIRDVADRVITGREIFLNPSEDEIEAAQARIYQKAQRDASWRRRRKKVA